MPDDDAAALRSSSAVRRPPEPAPSRVLPERPRVPTRSTGRAARQAGLREHNLSLTLRHVLDADGSLSRADISAATGLARATVSGLVDLLIEAGLVRELVPEAARRVGRPAVPLVPAQGTVAGLGMEVNVDYVGVRAVDIAGRVLIERIETGNFRASDPETVLARLAGIAGATIASLSADGVRIAGTALALPGLVDRVTGPLRVAPKLGWRDVDVVALMTAHPVIEGFPPHLANEANLAARAEAHARRRGGPPSFVYVSGEIGIGGAIVLDGEIFRGRHGWSGEIGHLLVDPFGARDGRVTLEDFAGQDALMTGAGLDPARPIADLVAAVRSGQPGALESIDSAAQALGVALANVANVVDISEIVLGGTFAPLFRNLREPVTAQLARNVLFAPWSRLKVSEARAGDYPAITGAALAVLGTVVADPGSWMPVVGR
ncbi:ROK family transcriptional regulator [Pengzhenrongella sicca]|uniref:ROK family transcriptional regulator n=1 Tax=Pengzhenrongella sicca TaxID=2819238 RepID=A0A8A4ZGY9_9MICO|nr:ROK family transcriptional regulator [Pengzhenrongella sicca]QTE29796.1 ROK family transcriptional regulator [Pengzhenrongella sicca]